MEEEIEQIYYFFIYIQLMLVKSFYHSNYIDNSEYSRLWSNFFSRFFFRLLITTKNWRRLKKKIHSWLFHGQAKPASLEIFDSVLLISGLISSNLHQFPFSRMLWFLKLIFTRKMNLLVVVAHVFTIVWWGI